jgi:hypothetical protein
MIDPKNISLSQKGLVKASVTLDIFKHNTEILSFNDQPMKAFKRPITMIDE